MKLGALESGAPGLVGGIISAGEEGSGITSDMGVASPISDLRDGVLLVLCLLVRPGVDFAGVDLGVRLGVVGILSEVI